MGLKVGTAVTADHVDERSWQSPEDIERRKQFVLSKI